MPCTRPLWKRKHFVREFLLKLNYFENIFPLIIFQDNKSAITLSSGGTFHKRSKHFGLEFDLFREYVSLKEISLIYRETDKLAADMLTKPLPPGKFTKFRDEVMGEKNSKNIFSH